MLMQGLAIEREVVIEAPVEVVWRTITEGGPVVVETVEPPTRFSFRWNYPSGQEPVVGNSMLVEFTLTPEGPERTRLRVVESGHELRDWPDEEKRRYADEHEGGWGEYLDRLPELLAKRR